MDRFAALMINTSLEVSVDEYLRTFDWVLKGTAREPYVTRFDSPENIYLVSGFTGCVIIQHENGRIECGGLFNGGPSGAGLALLDFAITYYGVNYVECFEPLQDLYARLGFVVESRAQFDWNYAPSNWHPSLGTPDYYTMVRMN